MCPPPAIQSIAEDEEGSANAADDDAGLVLPPSSDDEDPVQDAGLAGTSGTAPAGGEPDCTVEGDGEAGPPRGHGHQQKRHPDLLLSALREFCRRANACIARQGRDRVNGRFLGQDIRDAIAQLTKEEQDHLSGDDYVGVLEEADGKAVVRIALVERLLRITTMGGGKRRGEHVNPLATDDANGELVLRLLRRYREHEGAYMLHGAGVAPSLCSCP